jgi:HEAT repeat protein
MAPVTAGPLSSLIAQLLLGEHLPAASLTGLSDLDKSDAAQLQAVWPEIPFEIRLDLLTRATELAEDNVELDFTQLLLVGLHDESAEVRQQAAKGLYEAPLRPVAARLLQVLRDDRDPDVRAAAATSLRQFVLLREFGQFEVTLGDDVVAGLREVFDDDEAQPPLRAAALESLGARSLPWVANLIAESYNDDERAIRLAAVRAMGDSADDRWLDYLFEQLHSDDPEFRYAAVLSCGLIAAEDSVEPLTALLNDEDSEVVLATIAALGEVGGDGALAVLRDYAETAPPEHAEVVAEAIQAAAEFASGDEDDDTEDGFEE